MSRKPGASAPESGRKPASKRPASGQGGREGRKPGEPRSARAPASRYAPKPAPKTSPSAVPSPFSKAAELIRPEPEREPLPQIEPVAARLIRPLLPERSPEAGADLLQRMTAFEAALLKALDLRPKHRRQLASRVRLLSESLTSERASRDVDYMSDPAWLAPYAAWFLPWNVLRLVRLLPSLPLELRDGATLVDLGSGPLTLPIALWLARPELREKRLNVVCVDRSPAAMRLGLSIFKTLTGQTGEADEAKSPWRFTLVHGGFHHRLRERADLLTAVNVLNELPWRAETMSGRAEEVAESLAERLAEGGQILLVEPGVRRGGKILSHMRQGLAEQGLAALSPCPHQAACPALPAPGRSKRIAQENEAREGAIGWCHFTFPPSSAPGWLEALGKEASLPKTSLAVSWLLAGRAPALQTGRAGGVRKASRPGEGPRSVLARIISGSIRLPGRAHPRGAYACTEMGLALVAFAPGVDVPPPGAGVLIEWPQAPEKDPKSGAWEIPVRFDLPPAIRQPRIADRRSRPAPSDATDRSGRPDRPGRPDRQGRPGRKPRADR